jgi:ferric-dicitrate binding protein FerR (iron transport regulator)
LRVPTGSLSLGAGQVGLAGPRGLARGDVPASRYAEWTEGRLSFSDAPLSEVVAELSRWFDADVRVDDRAASRRVSAGYVNPTLSTALSAIAHATGTHVQHTTSAYVLRPASSSPP